MRKNEGGDDGEHEAEALHQMSLGIPLYTYR
jgi:hypothetical protein